MHKGIVGAQAAICINTLKKSLPVLNIRSPVRGFVHGMGICTGLGLKID